MDAAINNALHKLKEASGSSSALKKRIAKIEQLLADAPSDQKHANAEEELKALDSKVWFLDKLAGLLTVELDLEIEAEQKTKLEKWRTENAGSVQRQIDLTVQERKRKKELSEEQKKYSDLLDKMVNAIVQACRKNLNMQEAIQQKLALSQNLNTSATPAVPKPFRIK